MWRLGALEHVIREAKQYKRLQLLDIDETTPCAKKWSGCARLVLRFKIFNHNFFKLMNFLFVFVCSLLVCVFFVHVFGESNNKNNNRLRYNRRESKSRSNQTHKWVRPVINHIVRITIVFAVAVASDPKERPRRKRENTKTLNLAGKRIFLKVCRLT